MYGKKYMEAVDKGILSDVLVADKAVKKIKWF